MNLKDGVVFDERMHPSMWYAREVIGSLHREWADQEGTITSAFRDQSPGGSSFHPLGRALDIRIWAFEDHEEVRAFAKKLRTRLGPDFDVIVEGPAAEHPKYLNRAPHIHVEWDFD
jgi:predicted dehydrogenase